jgi:TPR repeat protein
MKSLFFCMLMAVVGLAQLSGQVNPAEVTQKFQESAQLNDERVKVFLELEAKAEDGDQEALGKVGNYYYFGQFPVAKNPAKAKALWTKGAALGSEECASSMFAKGYPASNETEVIIERTKWQIIHAHLWRIKHKSRNENVVRKPDDISESSFEEAKLRAQVFLASSTVVNRDNGAPKARSERFRLPSISTIADANAFRTELLTEFRKVQGPIYHNQVNAAASDAAAYAAVAEKIIALQSKGLGISPQTSTKRNSYNAASVNKIADLRAQLRALKINSTAPFTRQDANNAQVFLDRYRDLLDALSRGL